MTLRSISAIVTCSETCVPDCTLKLFCTDWVAGRNGRAAVIARFAASGVAAEPPIVKPPGLGVTRADTPGMLARIALAALPDAAVAGTTAICNWLTNPPAESSAAKVVPPTPVPNTNRLLALAGRTSAILGSAT